LRKLPPELALTHAEKDDFSIEQIIFLVPGLNSHNSKSYSAALRAIFLSMLHKTEIGEEIFREALRLMHRGVVMQMFEESSQ